MDTFEHDGLVFDVTDSGAGSGPGPGPGGAGTIVLLHGFPQNRHEWDGVTPALVDAGYRTLAFDQRGYSPGARPKSRRAYTQSHLVADVLALLDGAGIEQVHLVGHDWGALVAWAFASRHPDRLLTLTTISVPHPQALAWAMPRGQLLRSWYMAAFQLPVLPELVLSSRVGAGLLGDEALTADALRTYLEPLGREGLTAALNWYRALPFSRSETGYAHKTTVPTTYVWGDADPALGRKGAEATARFVTGPYRFVELAGVAHWIPDVVPDQLAALILDRAAG
jgi:pimeloyl-ACP methyl ester carboxylesterase